MDESNSKSRSTPAIVHDAIATIVRPASVVAFGAELLAVLILWSYRPFTGQVPPASLFGQFQFMFTDRLDVLCGAMALGGVVACGILAILRRCCPGERLKSTIWCLWLNIAAIVFLILAPAVQSA